MAEGKRRLMWRWSRQRRRDFLIALAKDFDVAAAAQAVERSEEEAWELWRRSLEFQQQMEMAVREGYMRVELRILGMVISSGDKPAEARFAHAMKLMEFRAKGLAGTGNRVAPGQPPFDLAAARKQLEDKFRRMNLRLSS